MRPVIVIMAAAFLIGLAYHAWPAVNPDQETPRIRPQAAKDAKQHKSRCTTHRIIILYTRGANGEPVPMIAALVSVPCEK